MDWEISQYLSWNSHEFSFSLILCFTTEVSPRSKSCLENTSENSDNRSAASLQSSGDQDMHPNRSICSSMVPSGQEPLVLYQLGTCQDPCHHLQQAQDSASPYFLEWQPQKIKCPIGVTGAYMPRTSLAVCIWPTTH